MQEFSYEEEARDNEYNERIIETQKIRDAENKSEERELLRRLSKG